MASKTFAVVEVGKKHNSVPSGYAYIINRVFQYEWVSMEWVGLNDRFYYIQYIVNLFFIGHIS